MKALEGKILCELPIDSGFIVSMEQRNGFLWCKTESGRSFRVDQNGNYIESTIRIAKE